MDYIQKNEKWNLSQWPKIWNLRRRIENYEVRPERQADSKRASAR